jgi:pyruvate/2-oxoglutarate/acetoin dehydrogenase E1 component/TPP-dependent pyruvate/acetoin dehydrogenase alpha subunit
MGEPTAPPRSSKAVATKKTYTEAYRQEVLRDYRLCCVSRELSKASRKAVLNGRASFGVLGDGKEVAQVAMAKAWKPGDFRAGYYRDQTLMMALGILTVDVYFAQLYADTEHDTLSGGRQMSCHFVTPTIDAEGNWRDLKNHYQTSSDIAPTGGQMGRALGLAFSSKKFRENPALCGQFSDNGNEVVFCTIGDASTSEGVFWETVNAAAVLQVPLSISVWDDGYGISVPKKYQTAKESISDILRGFEGEGGMDIYVAKAWDYPGLCAMYQEAIEKMRRTHRPALFHIEEVTQQLGHSTSGDHRRYKSAERLAWEVEHDCNRRMADWMVREGIATPVDLKKIEDEARREVSDAAQACYDKVLAPAETLRQELTVHLEAARRTNPEVGDLNGLIRELSGKRNPLLFDVLRVARRALFVLRGKKSPLRPVLEKMVEEHMAQGERRYGDFLYSQTPKSPLLVPVEPAVYTEDAPLKDGFEILNACFDANFERYPELFAFGEDVGQIGDVNQGFRGLQQKHGIERIFDTGIREWSIMGKAIGMALRGLRPIAEIQYIDYLLYGLPPLSDDLASLRWRTFNQQAAPAIIRTRGHRLVGVWHAGSPMSLILSSLRGMRFCVPRNMTQAAGMYNTLLRGDDPAIVVEVLNAYRVKEQLPDNIGTFTVPLGVPEVLRAGTDVTIITYGACVAVVLEAAEWLEKQNIFAEIIDVQTLIPFDLPYICLESIKKTNRVVFLDEDVPGGASAFMLQQVLEEQGAYRYLDAAPVTISGKEHRPSYGQDGDYFSKPQTEDVIEAVFGLMRE